MYIEGKPERSVQRCGQEIARLRTLRKWSRSKLIARLYSELDPDDSSYEHLSEAWLKRLENGQMVKLQRQTVEAFCRALRCTPRERASLLLLADRNILHSEDNVPNSVAEVLNYTMFRLYDEAYEMLEGLIEQQRTLELEEQELFELVATALELVIKRRRQR